MNLLILLLVIFSATSVFCSKETDAPREFMKNAEKIFKTAYATANKDLILDLHDKDVFKFHFCNDSGNYNDLANWLSTNMGSIASGHLKPGFISKSTEPGSDFEAKYTETYIKKDKKKTETKGTIFLKKSGNGFKIVKATENCPADVRK